MARGPTTMAVDNVGRSGPLGNEGFTLKSPQYLRRNSVIFTRSGCILEDLPF